jgi:hypothetical protein
MLHKNDNQQYIDMNKIFELKFFYENEILILVIQFLFDIDKDVEE